MTDEIAGDEGPAKRQSKPVSSAALWARPITTRHLYKSFPAISRRVVTIATMLLCHSKSE
jgi:hypothetical protein